MNDKARERLQRLRDVLEDMSGTWGPFGFGMLRTVPAFVPNYCTWEYLEGFFAPRFAPRRKSGRITKCDSWLDRSPTWHYCIWWWGDKRGVEEYKKWGDKMYGLISDYPELVSLPSWLPETPCTNLSTGSYIIPSGPPLDYRLGYHGSLVALLSFAAQDPALARIEESVILEGRTITGAYVQDAPSTIPRDGMFYPWLKYVFTEVYADGITFARQVMDRLLGRSRHEFHVDVKNKAVRLDDVTFHIEDEDVLLVLQFYEEAAGNLRTYDWIREQSPLLHGVRIERVVIPKIPEPIRNLIKRVRGKGSWLDLSCP